MKLMTLFILKAENVFIELIIFRTAGWIKKKSFNMWSGRTEEVYIAFDFESNWQGF